MKKVSRISDTEWQVMKVVWSSHPVSANQVVEKLEGVSDWKPKTVKTLLNRLVNKKILGFNKENRSYSYYPLVSEDECIKAEGQSFLERVYDGAFNLMIANFLEDKELTKAEIEELKKILDKKGD